MTVHDEPLTDDQSHYEVSLTAGQAFLAFVLLLLSLAASFAFGLVIGRGQNDDRMLARKEAAVVTESNMVPKKPAQTAAVDVSVKDDDFKPPEIKEDPLPAVTSVAPAPSPATAPAKETTPKKIVELSVPHYAQLLSTSDQKTAEALAAKLIDGGFTSAYVERGLGPKGTVYRVRIKFPSDEEAKAAEPKLKTFSKDVWITK